MDLFEAIQDWFADDTILSAAIPGGLWLIQAPPKNADGRPIARPYAVLVDLGNSFEFTSGEPYIDTHAVQFSIFSTTQATGETARAALRARFDAVKIPIDTAETSVMMCLPEAGETTREDNNIWHTRIDYVIQIHRVLE